MPSGRFKSRTFARVQKKLPSGVTKKRYIRRKPQVSKCSCGAVLKGIPRARPTDMKDLPASKKRVERTYGGNLCSKCSRKMIVAGARK